MSGSAAGHSRKASIVASRVTAACTINVKGKPTAAPSHPANVLDAYSQRDAEKALDVWRRDQELDAIYNSVFRELLTYMMEDPRNIGLCTHLLFGAKNLERIGDHATNIAEMIHFLVKGNPVMEQRPKGDTTSFAMPERPTV